MGRLTDHGPLHDGAASGDPGAGHPTAAGASHWRRSRRLQSALLAAGAALAAGAVAIVALRAWRMDLHVPLQYAGDALLHLGYVQNMVETGWYLEGPRLGAPFGQQHHDYPLGPDQAHMLLMRGLTLLTGEAPASVNIFYLLTFPLAALTAFWAMRRLRVPGLVAAFGALTFALLPYHFLRSTGHLFLSAYYTVPLSCYLVVATLEGRRFFGFGRNSAQRSRLERVLDIAAPATLALLVASGGAYYAVFTLALLAPATLMASLRTRSRSVLASGSLLIVLIIAFVGLNSLPSLQYRLENGTNPDVPVRGEQETEKHALRPVTLVLPIVGHRFEPFASLAQRYNAFPTLGERGESLGLVGAAGLLGLLAVSVGGLTGAFGRGRRWMRHRGLAALTLIAVVLAVTGGASTLIALLVSPQIRAWARLSIFIAFFALLAVCLVLGWLWRAARASRLRPVMAVALVGLMVVAALDQTSNRFVPPYGPTRDQFLADRAFVEQVEAALPAGSAVWQLPHRPYPEGGLLEDSPDYDPMRAYLHSRSLRWSYGGMKGREAGWQSYVQGRPIADSLPMIAAAGFSAVWVDRWAYPDRGVATEARLRALVLTDPLVSLNERSAVYDIRTYAASVRSGVGEERWAALEAALLAPIWPEWREGVIRGFLDGGQMARGAAGHVQLVLDNDGPDGREVVVSFTVATAHGPSSEVEVRWPDGTLETLITTNTPPLHVQRSLLLAAGDNVIEWSTDAPELAAFGGSDILRLRIGDVWALDPELLHLASEVDVAGSVAEGSTR